MGVVGCAATLGTALVVSTAAAQSTRSTPRTLPPLTSTIVEGLSMGGVEIGMTENEVAEQWGKPKSSACHGSAGSEPPGSPGYEYGGRQCDWDIEFTAMGVSSGLVWAFFAPGTEEFVVRTLTIWREAKLAKYRRWRTSKGIGLGSSLDSLKRAYGGRLRKVPFRHADRLPETDRCYYVATTRGGGKWITSFSLPTATAKGREKPPPAYMVDRVAVVDIRPSASFRQYWRDYAPSGWRP